MHTGPNMHIYGGLGGKDATGRMLVLKVYGHLYICNRYCTHDLTECKFNLFMVYASELTEHVVNLLANNLFAWKTTNLISKLKNQHICDQMLLIIHSFFLCHSLTYLLCAYIDLLCKQCLDNTTFKLWIWLHFVIEQEMLNHLSIVLQ